MAHYDYLYENVTEKDIKESIASAENRLEIYRRRVYELEADLHLCTLFETSVDVLKNAKEQDESIVRGIQESIEKMTKMLDKIRNGEEILYAELLRVR
ncbi:hypothetical protein Goe25_01940 [Bacillus phage vB_BsuM-Goe25]|nr:hypothetical protein Goe17_01980 [Bacillus phage vB_BsuM-Goe17]WCS69312.1 hypothetical protein Goe20_01950 [Bacillus phage vB_BsuM-Goe20]WCS69822.1 hypothetical protein Goe25_01940 [Bacillus phage vB_BsuM-Goe25]